MKLTSFNYDILLLVYLELSPKDIISLRQVCRLLSYTTRTKSLWISLLKQLRDDEDAVLPPYVTDYANLDSIALENLVRRVTRLTQRWASEDLYPVSAWRLYLPQSITWLRLVSGTWLFVASSDTTVSKITCWDLSLIHGSNEPLAEAYLPGRVKTGKLEVQDSGIILALGLGPESLSIHIITLRKDSGRAVFCELSRIEDCSHVLMLFGDFVGCGVRGGRNVPHLINWKERRIYDIIPPPGGLDVPGRRSVPHLMTIWGETLIIIRSNGLEFYTKPLTTSPCITFFRLIKTPTIWEVAVCERTLICASTLRLLVLTPDGIEMLVVERYMLDVVKDEPISSGFCLAQSPHYRSGLPWFRLCQGETGRRCFWMSAYDNPMGEMHPPCLTFGSIPRETENQGMHPIACSIDAPEEPATWAIPVIHFDEALGLTVVGNCFGELALYDHCGRPPYDCARLTKDFAHYNSPIHPLLPTTPMRLDLLDAPIEKMTPSQLVASRASKWAQDDLELSWDWNAAHFRSDSPHFPTREHWEGIPCDHAWLLEHAYGFPGEVIPQAYAYIPDNGAHFVLLRVGDRYVVYSTEAADCGGFLSWPHLPLPVGFDPHDPELEACTRQAACAEGELYSWFLFKEERKGRNRWLEQSERGGQLSQRLLQLDSDDEE